MIARKIILPLLLLAAWLVLSAGSSLAVALPYSDDFEGYARGSYPTASGWRTLSAGASAGISEEAAFSGVKSLKLASYSYLSRCDYLLLDAVPERLSYQAAVYMDPAAGRTVWLGLMTNLGRFYDYLVVTSGDGVVGTVSFVGASGTPLAVVTFPVNSWLALQADLDFAQLTAELWVNGVSVASDVPIVPQSFIDPQRGMVELNRFGVTERTWSGTRFGTVYLDDAALFETPLPAIEVGVTINPETLNLRSRGRWVTCYVELPEGYGPEEVDVASLRLMGEVAAELHPTAIEDYDGDGVAELMVKFDRAELAALLSPGEQEVELTGALLDGTQVVGSDVIRVLP